MLYKGFSWAGPSIYKCCSWHRVGRLINVFFVVIRKKILRMEVILKSKRLCEKSKVRKEFMISSLSDWDNISDNNAALILDVTWGAAAVVEQRQGGEAWPTWAMEIWQTCSPQTTIQRWFDKIDNISSMNAILYWAIVYCYDKRTQLWFTRVMSLVYLVDCKQSN